MKIGYARVSTDAQETHLQLDALTRAKCSRIYQEKASGATAARPELLRLWICSHDTGHMWEASSPQPVLAGLMRL